MYRIELKKQAKKFMDKLPPPERKRIIHEIERLPDGKSMDIKPLKGHPGLLRLRVGDYRIIYTVDHGKWIVLVIDIGNRGQIYRRY